MANVRVICALAIIIAMSMTAVVYGGPARSLAAVVAARTIKIPRTIRAPFRNDQIMTARGFGKRSQQFIKFRDGNGLKAKITNIIIFSNQFPAGNTDKSHQQFYILVLYIGIVGLFACIYGTRLSEKCDKIFLRGERRLNFLDELRPDNEIPWDNNKYDKQNPAEDQDLDLPDNYALEWIIDELKANPILLRSLLEHMIDRKHDDHTATQDLYGKSTNKPTPFY